jgi:hypothetical protein
MKKIGCMLVIAAMLGSVRTSQAQDSALEIANDFLVRIDSPQPLTENARTERLVDFGNAKAHVIVSLKDQCVTLYSIDDPRTRAIDRKVNLEEEKAAKIAEDFAAKAGVSLLNHREVELLQQEGRMTEYRFMYSEFVDGFPTTGNRAMIQVGSDSGLVTFMSRSVGYSVEPPAIRISEADALNRAAKRAEAIHNLPLEGAVVVDKRFLSPSDRSELTEAGVDFANRKRQRLAYCISGAMRDTERTHELSIFVDCETGKVVGGGIAKGSRPRVPDRSTEGTASNDLPRQKIAWGFGGVAFAGLAAFGVFKRFRSLQRT